MTCVFIQIQNSIVSSKALVLVIVEWEVEEYYATFLVQKSSQLNWG